MVKKTKIYIRMEKVRHWQKGIYCVNWVNPKRIEYCTPSTQYTDLNQHNANLDHPHAFFDRGYFYESIRVGQVLAGEWDKPSLLFAELLEYKAIEDHIKGIRSWRNSDFALRVARYISLGNKSRGFSDPNQYLDQRENEVDQLIKSIESKGVEPSDIRPLPGREIDDISINIGRKGQLLFNNRGHHRLAIAKVLEIVVPVTVIVWHKIYIDKHDFVFPACECFDCQIL